MDRVLASLEEGINSISLHVGRWFALLLPVLVLVIVTNVVLRYGFRIGMIELEELQWHINGIVVLACLAYAYRDDTHVRVDVIHAGLSERKKAWVELIGALFLLLPFVAGVAWYAWGNFVYSFSIGEGSPMPSGLPARYVIKLALFLGFALLGLQGIAAICRALRVLRGDVSRMRGERA